MLKGLPIFQADGEKLGYIEDLCISGNGEIIGVLMEKGLVFKKFMLIHLTDILSLGEDGMIVTEKPSLMEIEEGQNRLATLIGKPLFSSSGEQLGRIDDVYFQEKLGTIIGYECSDGFFNDMVEGKNIITCSNLQSIGKDAVIVNMKIH